MGRYDIALKKSPKASKKDALAEKTWLRISHYLGFDVDIELLSEDDAIVFGGAVRDSLADQPIHDVNMLVLPTSGLWDEEKLRRHGFQRIIPSNQEVLSYMGLSRGVQEPLTFFKNDSIIQLVRPVFTDASSRGQTFHGKGNLLKWLENSDISACGIAYDGKIHEVVPFAIDDCLNKTFSVNISTPLYQPDRAAVRIAKLVSRGWKQIKRESPKPKPPLSIFEQVFG